MPETANNTTAQIEIVTALFEQLERAWNRADGAAFGAPFTEDADFVDIRGTHHPGGRTAIAHGHQAIFDSIYAGSSVSYEVELAREVAPGTVVAIANATLDVPGGPMQGVNHSKITAVITGDDDDAAIAAFQNTLAQG